MDTCFEFPYLLTLIFEDVGVPLEGAFSSQLEPMDTITPSALKFIRLNEGVIADLESRWVDEEYKESGFT